MEDDKVAYLEDSVSKLEKQRKIIISLEKDRDALSEDITVVTCFNQSRSDQRMCYLVFQLYEHFENCKTSIKTSKNELKELEDQIRKVC